MKHISVNNGHSFCTPLEAIARLPWEVIYNALDQDMAFELMRDMCPCTEEEFLARYLELSPCDIVIG